MEELKVTWNGDREFTVEHGTFPPHTYRVVDKIPPGYFVWNIGPESMPEGYLPLCHWANPATWSWPGENKVDMDTLCAIKTRPNRVKAIMEASHYCIGRAYDMAEYIEAHKDAKRSSNEYKYARLMRKALPYLRQLHP